MGPRDMSSILAAVLSVESLSTAYHFVIEAGERLREAIDQRL